jgi:hypothetical protein|tara:strand:+ start:94 stop:345 length:252 start_codon:yes stop_codon:yes gene_type:complete
MKAEDILQNLARKNMVQWNQQDFQRTHSKLYKTIIEAIKQALNIDCVSKQRELLKAYEHANNLCNCDGCKKTANKKIEKFLSL